jgi:transposase-like protein
MFTPRKGVKMTNVTIKRYSLAFKQAVVREYENGESLTSLQKKYGITGNTTVKKWVEKYGRYGTRHKLMIIQKPEEQNRIRELEQRINQLEKALAQVTLDKLILTATLEVTEEKYGIKVKKTIGRPSLRPRTGKARRSR